MSTRRRHLLAPLAVASLLVATAVLPPLATASAATQDDAARERTFMRVVAPTVDVKSGPQDYYYGFARLVEGDIVEMVDEKANGFVSILTKGPRFVAGYALLRVRDDESFSITGPERQTASGRTARTGVSEQKLQVLYPNIDEADLLNRSWRMIRRIDAGTEVQVMGSPIEGDGVTLHRIPLPKDAVGFIPKASLTPASDAEAGDFLTWERDPAAWLARRRAEAEALAQAQEERRLAAAEAAEAAREEARRDAEAEAATAAVESEGETGTGTETETEVGAADPRTTNPPPVAMPEQTVDEASPPAADAGTGAGTGSASEADSGDAADPADASRPESGDRRDGAAEAAADPADSDAEGAEGEGETAEDAPSGSRAVSELPVAERLAALENAFDMLRTEDVRRVEVEPLARLYRALAADIAAEAPDKVTYATTRAQQLELWARLQAQRDRIEALRADVGQTDAAVAEAARSIQAQLGFSAVGRLASSRIFDGNRLPRLLRLESLDSGRTIAYVRDTARLDLDSRVGDIVGLFGERVYDPGLQLDILDAIRVQAVRLDVEDGASR